LTTKIEKSILRKILRWTLPFEHLIFLVFTTRVRFIGLSNQIQGLDLILSGFNHLPNIVVKSNRGSCYQVKLVWYSCLRTGRAFGASCGSGGFVGRGFQNKFIIPNLMLVSTITCFLYNFIFLSVFPYTITN
jgi:hypothetical protein